MGIPPKTAGRLRPCVLSVGQGYAVADAAHKGERRPHASCVRPPNMGYGATDWAVTG